MADNPSIINAQAAFKTAADAAAREKTAASATPPKDDKPDEKGKTPPPPAKPQDTAPDHAAYIKERYGITEEELDARLKPNGNGKDEKPDSEKRPKRTQPAKEDIDDKRIESFFEKNKKADVFKEYSTLKEKDDLALVKESHRALLKQQFPNFKDNELDDLFNEQYFIAPDKNDDPYTDDEKQLGAFMLKNEAERLRNRVSFQVDAVRDLLYNEETAAYNMQVFSDAVDEFAASIPDKLVLTLGKSNEIELGDYSVKLEADTVKAAVDIMRNPLNMIAKFKAKDGEGLDLQKMYNFFIRGELFDHVIKSTAADYFSKGVESMENLLQNNPDLSKNGKPPADPKKSKKDDKEAAQDYNKKQLEENTGRGRR